MKNILFGYYPLYVKFSHGASLLTSLCKAKGIDADYMPCSDQFLMHMQMYDTVGFSFVTDLDYLRCLPYMKVAMEAGKQVLVGGIYASSGGIIDESLCHYICRGDAETIPDFILNGNTTIFDKRYFTENIDGLNPDFSHVTGYEFHRDMPFLQGMRIFPYQTSRGCPHHCSFCETQFQPKKVRIKHTIREDMINLVDTYRPQMVYIMDALIPYYLEEWREQWKYLNIPFQSYIRADIEPEHLEFLIEHGLKVTFFGVESGSERYRNETLKKGLTDEEIYRTVSILKKNNVVYIPSYIMGFPEKDEDHIGLTRKMLNEIGGWPIIWQYQNLEETRTETEKVNMNMMIRACYPCLSSFTEEKEI